MNIKDIAQLCGVSVSTVSKVLHNDETISKKTREKVLRITKEYNYVPYSKVLQNAAPRMNMIAVFLDNRKNIQKELLYHIEHAAFKHGYNIVLCNDSDGKKQQEKYIKTLESKGINGVVVLSGADVKQLGLPTVLVADYFPDADGDQVTSVYYERQKIAYIATKHLLSKAHKKIACLIKAGENEVVDGYRKAFEEAFIKSKEEWVFQESKQTLKEIVDECIRLHITGIVCSDAYIGNRMYAALQESRISIPEQMSVIGLDNYDLAKTLVPPMTTVQIPFAQIGEKTFNALRGMIEKQKKGRCYQCEIQPELVERNSVTPPSEYNAEAKIVVIGSMNMDYNVVVDNERTRGGTPRVKSTMTFPGGDGANQAVGIAKLGGNAHMVGCLGNDADGREVYEELTTFGVNVDGVTFCEAEETGKAYITVGSDDKNAIIIQEGANQHLKQQHIQKHAPLFDGAAFCLVNMEIPEETVISVIQLCVKKNVQVVVKPSAIEALNENIFHMIDYLVAKDEVSKRLVPEKQTVEERAEELFSKGIKNVIITLGEKGCYFKNEDYACIFPAEKFPVVDVTGAADAFISAMTVCLSRNIHIIEAIKLATYAAGISVTQFGVQQAMIDENGLETYRKRMR